MGREGGRGFFLGLSFIFPGGRFCGLHRVGGIFFGFSLVSFFQHLSSTTFSRGIRDILPLY